MAGFWEILMQKQAQQQTILAACDERILVVKRDLIFQYDQPWHGLKPCDYDWYLWAIEHYGQFHSRIAMENDPRYKQIIPYLVFMHDDNVFVVERTATASEARLASKLSIGIGGHIRQEDILGSTIFDWAHREFNEEVTYNDPFTFEPLGIVNDDTNSVGQVHLGFVFLVRGTTPHITVKSEFKHGKLTPRTSITDTSNFEPWSQIVLDVLKQ
jgi:predicted NUDIX family phosphoesterase